MSLSNDLVSAFVKITNDTKKEKTEKIAYGTVVENQDKSVTKASKVTLVRLDGADVDTPVLSTINGIEGDRVIVTFKNHTATVTGNLSSPSVVYQNIVKIENDYDNLPDEIFDINVLLAKKATVDQLNTEKARISELNAKTVTIREELDAAKADIEDLSSDHAEFKEATVDDFTAINARVTQLDSGKLSAEQADLLYADIDEFRATKGVVDNLKIASGDVGELAAKVAEIETLTAGKLSTEQADIRYANIDFSNIGEAAITKFFSESGIISNLVVSNGTITGKLVGVTISGDLIEGSTVKADKLVVKGSDGLYYKLNVEAGATTSQEVTAADLQNGLHGTAIIAKTITAEKISVDDLVAFGATIGGFNISNNSLYSGSKSSANNTTRGIYLGDDGQVGFGDANKYVKFYKDAAGNYKVAIAADEITFGNGGKNVQDLSNDVDTIKSHVKVDYDTDGSPILTLTSGAETVQLKITNSGVNIYENGEMSTYISNRMLNVDRIYAVKEAQVGPFLAAERTNGNVGIRWKGGGNG